MSAPFLTIALGGPTSPHLFLLPGQTHRLDKRFKLKMPPTKSPALAPGRAAPRSFRLDTSLASTGRLSSTPLARAFLRPGMSANSLLTLGSFGYALNSALEAVSRSPLVGTLADENGYLRRGTIPQSASSCSGAHVRLATSYRLAYVRVSQQKYTYLQRNTTIPHSIPSQFGFTLMLTCFQLLEGL